jgi:hypothetical protein
VKYLDNKNINYPRKNWSSFVIFNCQHPKNKILTPDFIENKDGEYLHRFSWLSDEDIGELEITWNYLAIEYDPLPNANLIHYTLGTPCFNEFKSTEMSDFWWDAYKRVIEGFDK